jgi:hypothetical protein
MICDFFLQLLEDLLQGMRAQCQVLAALASVYDDEGGENIDQSFAAVDAAVSPNGLLELWYVWQIGTNVREGEERTSCIYWRMRMTFGWGVASFIWVSLTSHCRAFAVVVHDAHTNEFLFEAKVVRRAAFHRRASQKKKAAAT